MKAANFTKGTFLVVPNKHITLKLRGASLNVYLALIDHADANGRGWPSYNRLSESTGYGRRQCIDAMKELLDAGLISKDSRQRGNGSDTTNMYQLQLIEGGEPQRTPSELERTPASAPQLTPPSEPQLTPRTQSIRNSNIKNSSASPALPHEAAGSRDYSVDNRGQESPQKEKLRQWRVEKWGQSTKRLKRH